MWVDGKHVTMLLVVNKDYIPLALGAWGTLRLSSGSKQGSGKSTQTTLLGTLSGRCGDMVAQVCDLRSLQESKNTAKGENEVAQSGGSISQRIAIGENRT